MDEHESIKYTVLRENEIDANKVVTVILGISGIIVAIIWLFIQLGIWYVANGTPHRILFCCFILMLSGVAVSERCKFDKRWLKYLLIGLLIIGYALLDAVFTYHATLIMVVPTVMSSRYFSRKYTLVVALTTYVAFCISAAVGANYGILDLNFLEFSAGTVIDMGKETWLSDAVYGLPYDKALQIHNVVRYSYVIKILLSTITLVASYLVAQQGRRMVLRQQALTEETASVETELAVAARIQASLLPSVFPAFPDRKEFDLHATMTPALQVGGDFYDFFLVDDDHLALVMADVSDKGIPAAMFMVSAKNTIYHNAKMGKSPAQTLIDANNDLELNNNANMFVTTWFGILQISTGLLTVCNAGHERPIIKQKGGEFVELRDKHGFAMGCIPDADYVDYEIQLEPGDKLFLYTDGVPEATDKDLKQFGIARTLEALNAAPDASPRQMLENVRAGVDSFVKDAQQFDDITMLAFEYKG